MKLGITEVCPSVETTQKQSVVTFFAVAILLNHLPAAATLGLLAQTPISLSPRSVAQN